MIFSHNFHAHFTIIIMQTFHSETKQNCKKKQYMCTFVMGMEENEFFSHGKCCTRINRDALHLSKLALLRNMIQLKW